MHAKRSARAVSGLAAALVLTACGSTVQVSSSSTGELADGGSGLEAPGTATAPLLGQDTAVSGAASSATPRSGTTVTGGSTTTPSSGPTAGAAAVDGAGQAAVGDRSPLELGVVLTSTASAGDYGFSTGESYSEKQVDDALFQALNAQGGLLGRKVVPVYAATDPNASNWSTEFAAACATFTQDHEVKAVVGYQFTYDNAFETCLTKASVPHLTTGFNIPDAQELARHPLHRALAVPTIDARSRAKIDGAFADGVLTKASKLGVVLDSCPGTESSWTRVAQPMLRRHGLVEATVYRGACGSGNNASAADQVSGVPNGIVKMRQAGVDTVTFLTVSEGPALAVVAAAAESQGWRPTYLMSSLAALSTFEGQLPASQLRNVKSYGWMPAQDVAPIRQPAKSAAQKRCLGLLERSKVKAVAFGDFINAYRICDAVFAYEAALRAATTTGGPSLVAALDGLGASFDNPDVLDGATLLGPSRRNVAPSHVRAVVWKDDCSCFVYTGPTRTLS